MQNHRFILIWKHPELTMKDWFQCPDCGLRWTRSTLIDIEKKYGKKLLLEEGLNCPICGNIVFSDLEDPDEALALHITLKHPDKAEEYGAAVPLHWDAEQGRWVE